MSVEKIGFYTDKRRFPAEAVALPRRFRATTLLLSVVLLYSGCLVLGGCRFCLPGDAQSADKPQAGPQIRPVALAGLLPKPVLPELQVTCGRSVSGIRAGYTWSLDGNAKQLEEVWPPPAPSGRLLVSPGEEVTFTVTLPPGSPDAVTAGKDAATGRLDAWYEYSARDLREVAPLYSGRCEARERKNSVVRFSWRLPDELARQPSGNSFVVRFAVAWRDLPGASSDVASSPRVSFYWSLTVVDKDVQGAVLDAARRYFEAAWGGDEETLSKLSPQWLTNEPETVPGVSPLRANLPGPRRSIFWKSPSQAFKLVSRPSFRVDSVHTSASGPYAQCLAEYEVEVRDVQSGQSERQTVNEQIGLERGGDGSWRLSWASRQPSSTAASGGKGPAAPGAVLRLPAAAVREEDAGVVVKIGPFEVAQFHFGQKWSDDGEWFAFEASVASANGVWVVSRDGSKLLNLVALEGTAVEVLDWAPGQHRVRFLAYGHHSCGPHADKSGYWIGEVDLETREVRDVAFVRYPKVLYPRDVAIPEGRRYLVFRHTPDLWRVDMETGDVKRVAGDVPSWDGLLRLRYSPSAWLAAYGEPSGSGRPGLSVYDLKAGEQRFVSLSDTRPGEVWAHFEGWTPREELMVLVCPVDEVNHGEDSSEPAGATALRVYGPTGELLREVLPPGGDADSRIGPVAWNADGSALAVATGYLTEPARNPLGWSEMRHEARAIYVWTRSDGALRKAADVSGQIRSLSWVDSGKAVEAWFREPDDRDVKIQSGVRIDLDGSLLEVQRPIRYRVDQGDVVIGSLANWVLIERFGAARGSSLVVRAGSETGDGRETLVNDVGPLHLGEPVMTSGAFAISGEIPETYGQGDHWVYLVVQRSTAGRQ